MEGAGKDPKPRAYSPGKYDAGYKRIDWSKDIICPTCNKVLITTDGATRHTNGAMILGNTVKCVKCSTTAINRIDALEQNTPAVHKPADNPQKPSACDYRPLRGISEASPTGRSAGDGAGPQRAP
jgi:phage FluMu protein Com